MKRSATIHKLLQVGGAICIAHLLQSLSGVVTEKFFGIICRPIIRFLNLIEMCLWSEFVHFLKRKSELVFFALNISKAIVSQSAVNNSVN